MGARWSAARRAVLFGIAAAALLAAGPVRAQEQLRRFTQDYWDVNRSNRIVYVPVGFHFSGPPTGKQQYDVSVATWYLQPLGVRSVRPDKVLDKGEYSLDQLELVGADTARPSVSVVITRRPAPPEGTPPPAIDVVHPNGISARPALATVEPVDGGVRYSFMVSPPLWGFSSPNNVKERGTLRYEVRLLSGRDTKLPNYLTRAPTFGGLDTETRMSLPPPQLPYVERVAGRRIEYRSGNVVQDTKKR